MYRRTTVISLLASMSCIACGSDSTSQDTDETTATDSDATGSAGHERDGGSSAVDTGGDSGPGPTLTPSAVSDTFFRADTLKFVSPDIVLNVGVELPITDQAQVHLSAALTSDTDPDNNGDGMANAGDGDGFLDLSMLLRFRGSAEPASGEGGQLGIGPSLCPYPYGDGAVCHPNPEAPFPEAPLQYKNSADCKLDGTSERASGACFKTVQTHFDLGIPLLVQGTLPLEDAEVIGSWVDDGHGGVVNGQIRGFLTAEAAGNAKLGKLSAHVASLGIQSGAPLMDFLPAKQVKNDGASGWWFAVSFSAKPAKFDSSAAAAGK